MHSHSRRQFSNSKRHKVHRLFQVMNRNYRQSHNLSLSLIFSLIWHHHHYHKLSHSHSFKLLQIHLHNLRCNYKPRLQLQLRYSHLSLLHHNISLRPNQLYHPNHNLNSLHLCSTSPMFSQVYSWLNLLSRFNPYKSQLWYRPLNLLLCSHHLNTSTNSSLFKVRHNNYLHSLRLHSRTILQYHSYSLYRSNISPLKSQAVWSIVLEEKETH